MNKKHKGANYWLFSHQSLSPKIPDTNKISPNWERQTTKELRHVKYTRRSWTLSLPPPHPHTPDPSWDWVCRKFMGTPHHWEILEERDSCALSWGESGEALGVPCTPQGTGTDNVAMWFPWAARHSRWQCGSIRSPPIWAAGKQVGPDGKQGCAQDARIAPPRPFLLVSEDQREQPSTDAGLC